MKTIKAIQVYKSDDELQNLLNAWINAIIRYTSTNEYDNPWWYNERASLSVLAGAAWTLENWLALEEFSTMKRYRTLVPGVDSGSLRHGRCDLFVQSPNSSFAIEAKQTVQSIGSRSDGNTYIARAMRRAWEDSGDLSKKEAYRRFAVTFIVPYIPVNEVLNEGVGDTEVCPEKVEKAVNDWLSSHHIFSENPMKNANYAYVFPKLGNKNYSLNRKHYPGIIVFFEERFRAHRQKNSNEL